MRAAPCCPSCGALLPPKDLTPLLPPGLQELFEMVRRAGVQGITVRTIADRVYADDIDGGPDNPEKAVRSRFTRLNGVLRPHGLVVVSRPASGPEAVRYLERYDGTKTNGRGPGAGTDVRGGRGEA